MTLVEMVVLIGIYTVLLLVISASISELYRSNAYTMAQAEEIENGRRALTQWNRDAKEMTAAEDGTYPIDEIEEQRFAFYSNTDQDDLVEYVVYEVSGTTLTKYKHHPVGSPAVYDLATPDETIILSEFVQNISEGGITFRYYDNAGNELTAASPIIDVRYIVMEVVVNIDPLRSPGEFMLRSSIAPRNLKDNL